MSKRENNMIGGLVLVAIGGYFLLRNLGVIPHYFRIDWDIIWPLGLLALGVYLITKHRK
jgi:hypothetical protein